MYQPWRAVVLITALIVCAAGFFRPSPWHYFHSSSGFTVAYPGNWYRFGDGPVLNLRSSKGGAEGFIFKRGQAYAWVTAESDTMRSMDDVIRHYTVWADSVTARHSVPVTGAAHACQELVEVTSTERAAAREDAREPLPDIVNTGFFCQIGERYIVTMLRNWADDPKQNYYRQTALRIARSIRIGPKRN